MSIQKFVNGSGQKNGAGRYTTYQNAEFHEQEKHGKWIHNHDYTWKCTSCGLDQISRPEVCPMCGSKND